MGLGQVRDLRRKSIKRIIELRSERLFSSLDDLLERFSLQIKEITHLIQCGALDGLGQSRAALLAQAEAIQRAGSSRQMAFSFAGEPEIPAESPAQRLKWERTILGRPVSVHPLDLLEEPPADTILLRDLPHSQGQYVTAAGVRLPGWTGGPGFFLADRDHYVTVRMAESIKTPEPWLPLLVRGRWQSDEWGSTWLQCDHLRLIQR
jgi:hypothetical protein